MHRRASSKAKEDFYLGTPQSASPHPPFMDSTQNLTAPLFTSSPNHRSSESTSQAAHLQPPLMTSKTGTPVWMVSTSKLSSLVYQRTICCRVTRTEGPMYRLRRNTRSLLILDNGILVSCPIILNLMTICTILTLAVITASTQQALFLPCAV